MTKKEKFSYWFKIVYLAIFGTVTAAAAGYTLFAYPFSLAVLIYCLFMFGGSAFCVWAIRMIYKEYKHWIAKEKEDAAKQAEQKE